MGPNPECNDLKCRENQEFYSKNPDKKRMKEKEETKQEEDKPIHEENEWGITLDDAEDETAEKQEEKFVEVKDTNLDDLMKNMKSLQT